MDEDELESHARAARLGAYLKSLRVGSGMSLREVEQATENDVSNAYLSQLENGRIRKPSPHILHTLSEIYQVSYSNVMERAGYVSPVTKGIREKKHGRVATYAVENLSAEEETELLKYLAWYRSQRGA